MNCLNGPSLESPGPVTSGGVSRKVCHVPASAITSPVLLFLCWWSHSYLHQLHKVLPSAARILKHDVQTETRSVEPHCSFFHYYILPSCSPALISLHTTNFFTHTHPPIGFFMPVILPSIILSPSFPAILKSQNMLQCTWG